MVWFLDFYSCPAWKPKSSGSKKPTHTRKKKELAQEYILTTPPVIP